MNTNNRHIYEKVIPVSCNIDLLVSTAWLFCRISLWPCSVFSSVEADASQKALKGLFNEARDPYKAYLEFCQRVMLTRERILQQDHHIPLLPTLWLNIYYAKGYESSLPAFLFLQETRKKMPLYRQELKALPEAVLDLVENPSKRNFNYWISWFKNKNAMEEMLLFSSIASFNSFRL